ncbi:hypothetical protein N7499_005676 [Penicillium canescens]|nr:hypothetical protein N7499_005676 [Penicillium canescens]
MHWPVTLPTASPGTYGKEDRTTHDPDWDFTDTWREMEKLLATGKVRAIGVANFSTVNLEKLLKSCNTVPAVNQTEIQPLLPQKKLNALCTDKGIHQTAFGPLGGSGSTLHTDPILGCEKGWSVIPKSVNPTRIVGNLQKCFVMDDQEVAQIDQLVNTLGEKRFNRPNWGAVIFHDDRENVQCEN